MTRNEIELVEISGRVRLAPVGDPPGSIDIELPLIGQYFDLKGVRNASMMRALLLATYPHLAEGVIPTALDGGLCLLADETLLIESGCCCDLGDFWYWKSIAAEPNGPVAGMPTSSTTWRDYIVGHGRLLARAENDHIWIGELYDNDSPPYHPDRSPVWKVPRVGLETAVSEAAAVIAGLQSFADEALADLIDPALRLAAVEWILYGTGPYQALAGAR